MSRIGTRLLVITVGATDYTAQVTKAVVQSAAADSDTTTFADAAAGGGRAYSLNIEALQDAAASTLWDKVFTAAGTSVAVTLKPYGTAAASPTTPWFTMQATIVEPDGDFIGGEADTSTTAYQKFEVTWPLDAKPTRVTA